MHAREIKPQGEPRNLFQWWRGWGFWDEAKNYRKLFMHPLPIGKILGGDKRKNEKTNISNFSYRCGDNRSFFGGTLVTK